MKNNKHLPLFLTFLAAFGFIFPAAFVKLLMNEMNPIGTLSIRFFIAALCFPIIVFFMNRKKWKKIFYPKKGELEHFAFLAFLLITNMAIGFSAYYFIPANIGILIFLMYPVFDTILAWLFLHEPVTKADYIAISLNVVGAYFILGQGTQEPGQLIGYILAFIGMLLFAAYLVMSRSIGQKYEYYKRTAWLFIYSFFFLCIIFFFVGGVETIFHLSARAWGVLFLFATVSTLLPYMCLSYATAKMKSSIISIIVSLGPVAGIWLVTFLFDEPFSTNMWIGAICIISAFFLTSLIEWREEEKKGPQKHIKHPHH